MSTMPVAVVPLFETVTAPLSVTTPPFKLRPPRGWVPPVMPERVIAPCGVPAFACKLSVRKYASVPFIVPERVIPPGAIMLAWVGIPAVPVSSSGTASEKDVTPGIVPSSIVLSPYSTTLLELSVSVLSLA